MKTVLQLISLFIFQFSFSQDGTLDISFDLDGKKVISFATPNDYGEFVLIQPDSKIIVGGRSSLTGGALSFSLARLNSSGSFDNSFGVSGKVTTTYGADGFEAADAVLQSDGKIVVVGNHITNPSLGYAEIAVVRYNSNGSLDTTFDVDGIVLTQVPTSNEDYTRSVRIQPDGKIVIGSQTRINFDRDFTLIRYNTNGSLDTTFGTNGISRIIESSTNEVIYGIALQNDGKIVATGTISGAFNDDLAVFRFNSDGTLDTTFANAGKFTYDFASAHNYIFDVEIDSNNKIIIAGRYQNGVITSPFVARLNSNGTFDSSFDTDGILIQTTEELPNDVMLQSDNKILVVGTSNNKFGVWKLNENGTFDTAFGTNGKVETDVTTVYSLGNRGAIQSDGKIVVVGSVYGNPFSKYGVVRYANSVPLELNDFVKDYFLVYPIPSNGEFTIQTTYEMIGAKVEVYSAVGHKVKSFELLGIETKQNLNSGFYILVIEKDGQKTTQKILIN